MQKLCQVQNEAASLARTSIRKVEALGTGAGQFSNFKKTYTLFF